jgi:hypothetical protein
VLAAALAAVVEVSGNLPAYGLARAMGVVTATAGGLLLLALAIGLLWPAADAPASPRLAAATAWLPAVAYLTCLQVNPATHAGTFTVAGWGPRALGLAALALPAALGARALWTAAAALAVGVGLRAVTFASIDAYDKGDMLPLVSVAADKLLEGESPYRDYLVPWRLPLTYLPGTLLPYLPIRRWLLDPRLPGALCELAALAVVAVAATRRRADGADRLHHPVLPLLGALYLLPGELEWARITTAPVGWAVLTWALAALAGGARSAPVALGLAAGTTPVAAVVAPLALTTWLRGRGAAGALVRVAVAAAVAVALIAPFYLWAPEDFLDGVWRWFNDLGRFPRSKWQEQHTWLEHAGLAGLAWHTGREAWLKPLQAVAVAGVAALHHLRGARPEAVARHAGAALLLFMTLNPVIWPYFYQPAILAILLALARVGTQAASPPGVPSREGMGTL